jgi:hypothetical protein
MNKKFFTVMHVSRNQYMKIINLGNKVVGFLTTNALMFPAITNDAAALKPEVELLEQYQGKVDGGSELDTANRDDQAKIVYDMLIENLPDVDKVADGDKPTILLSGYDASLEPQPKDLPGTPTITKITDGPVDHSAKVHLDNFEVGAFHIAEYRKVGEQDWKLGKQTRNSRDLIITGLVKAEEIEVRVADQNTAGKGTYTQPMTFLPR